MLNSVRWECPLISTFCYFSLIYFACVRLNRCRSGSRRKKCSWMSNSVPNDIYQWLVRECVLTLCHVPSDMVWSGCSDSSCWAGKSCYHCSFNSVKVLGGYNWFNRNWYYFSDCSNTWDTDHLAKELAGGGANQKASFIALFHFPCDFCASFSSMKLSCDLTVSII